MLRHFQLYSFFHLAIEKYYVERNKKDPKGEFEMNFTVDEASECGEVGFVEGHYVLQKKADKSAIDNGK